MAYTDDIAALAADHHWDFDGNSNDNIGSANGTNTGVVFSGSAIAEDATNCMTTNGATDRVSLPTTTTINNSAQTRKAIAGWVELTALQTPPVLIYGEGNNATAFQFVMFVGNQIMLECIEPTNFTVQVFADRPLKANRVYHLCGIFEGNGFANEVRFYLDGVKQSRAVPADAAPDSADLNTRGVGEFGDRAGTSGVGGDVVILQAAQNCRYQHWAAWDGADAVLTDTEVLEELFEKGALPDVTITAGTEAAMQTNLDTYNTTERADAPLCIRVPANTGDTNFTLTADGITFDPLASIHVQYTGTATLTWRNDRDSAATKFSTPNGGTITVQNETNLKLIGLVNPTEVRVMEAGTQNEIVGEENVTDGEFDQFVYEDSVDIAIHSETYESIFLKGVDTSADVTLQIAQNFDRNYSNPA